MEWREALCGVFLCLLVSFPAASPQGMDAAANNYRMMACLISYCAYCQPPDKLPSQLKARGSGSKPSYLSVKQEEIFSQWLYCTSGAAETSTFSACFGTYLFVDTEGVGVYQYQRLVVEKLLSLMLYIVSIPLQQALRLHKHAMGILGWFSEKYFHTGA